AAFFAEVASIADPATLSPGQQLVLQEQATEVFEFTPDLGNLWKQSRALLLPLLRGEAVEAPFPIRWRLQDGSLHFGPVVGGPQLDFMGDLLRLISLVPFPFKQCPFCGKVFVSQSQKKRYCSPNCTYRGIEEARKERRRPEARERMRRLRK